MWSDPDPDLSRYLDLMVNLGKNSVSNLGKDPNTALCGSGSCH